MWCERTAPLLLISKNKLGLTLIWLNSLGMMIGLNKNADRIDRNNRLNIAYSDHVAHFARNSDPLIPLGMVAHFNRNQWPSSI